MEPYSDLNGGRVNNAVIGHRILSFQNARKEIHSGANHLWMAKEWHGSNGTGGVVWIKWQSSMEDAFGWQDCAKPLMVKSGNTFLDWKYFEVGQK